VKGMKWFNAERKLVINIILALILGVGFGNFLGSKILSNDAIYVNADQYDDEVYILQTGIYYDELAATLALNEVKAKGINGLIVKEHNKYYIYHGISDKSSTFDELIKLFDQHQIDYFVKTKSMYTLLTHLDSESVEYDFYYQSINYFLSLIRDQQVTLSNDYLDLLTEDNMDLFNHINSLNQNMDGQIAPITRLYIYQSLTDKLL
jgi:hypothetical protein